MKNNGELNLNAVVRLNMVAAIPNYSVPWQTKMLLSGIGSGVVIDGRRILTNAHNVANTTFITVLKHGARQLSGIMTLLINKSVDAGAIPASG